MSAKRKNVFSRMRRYPADGWVAGVCAGLAAHFDWNAKLLRVLFLLGLIFSGFFPVGVAYCLLWYLMDEAPGRAPAGDEDEDLQTGGVNPASGRPYRAPATMSDVKARFARLEERLNHMEESVTSNDYELRRELRKLES